MVEQRTERQLVPTREQTISDYGYAFVAYFSNEPRTGESGLKPASLETFSRLGINPEYAGRYVGYLLTQPRLPGLPNNIAKKEQSLPINIEETHKLVFPKEAKIPDKMIPVYEGVAKYLIRQLDLVPDQNSIK